MARPRPAKDTALPLGCCVTLMCPFLLGPQLPLGLEGHYPARPPLRCERFQAEEGVSLEDSGRLGGSRQANTPPLR